MAKKKTASTTAAAAAAAAGGGGGDGMGRRRREISRGWIQFAVLLATLAMGPGSTSADSQIGFPQVYRITEADQNERVDEEHIACLRKQLSELPARDELRCNTTWDGIVCWPTVEAGTLATQPCPSYINLFLINGKATRECTSDGTWFNHPLKNKSTGWTNYTLCTVSAESGKLTLSRSQMLNLRIIYNVGYGLSLASLTIALATMLYFKKLHCPRNTIHVNLFVSFALRAVITFLKENLFVDGLAFSKDIDYNKAGMPSLNDETHWECKLFIVLFNYILSANYMWIFVEGLYLHMLLFVSVFSERSSICGYIILGWVGPMTFVIPWAVIRATVATENIMCWNVNQKRAYFWVLNLPIVFTVIVNFIFFVRIVSVLFSKLQASNVPDGRRYRYVKLAKSTLVLIPLFGVPYMVFLWVDPKTANRELEAVKIYYEMIFNSSVGFLIAVLFCFLNGEVQSEVRKTWQRFQLSRGVLRSSNRSVSNTMVTDVTRGRSSLPSIHERVDCVVVVNGVAPCPLLPGERAIEDKEDSLVLSNDTIQCHLAPGQHPEQEFLISDGEEDEKGLTQTGGVATTIDEGVVLSEGESNL